MMENFSSLRRLDAYNLQQNLTTLEVTMLKQVTSLELSTGIPLLYIYKEGKFSSRGSPVGPTEDGVHAYTQREYFHFVTYLLLKEL
ncbi:hypothetical protein TSUD_94170 [Trifolium subterraneum]|uniref:Uncharacterized protein n=1 Tax=Trifolium subterraneum TaxID=3900 RepID=A0A2Z6NDC7_TRISU|nr:hypothetical protein TSUD_94170 [Trifolium subterraneum]